MADDRFFNNPKPRCHYCRTRGVKLTKDHIVPLALGGQDRNWNIVLACEPCNQTKADTFPVCPCNLCHDSIVRHEQRYGISRHGERVRVPKGRSSYARKLTQQ